MAGVPFDFLELCGTLQTSRAAREQLLSETEFLAAASNLEKFLRDHSRELPRDLFRAWKKSGRSGIDIPSEPRSGVFEEHRQAALKLSMARQQLDEVLQEELASSRHALLDSARKILPRYLVFAEPTMRRRLEKQLAIIDLPPRNKQSRAEERHLLLYMQRVCAKNDSMSEFGPCAWGEVHDETKGLCFAPEPGIFRRETFLERWTAHAAAAVLNADPDIRPELCPHLNPDGRLQGHSFIFARTGETVLLDPGAVVFLQRCDGKNPAHTLSVPLATLADLAARNVIKWEIEVPALEPHAFDVLIADIQCWRDSPARARWLDTLMPISNLPAQFAQAKENSQRTSIIDEASTRLGQLGAGKKESSRFLYAASNPIGEECFRQSGFSIDRETINAVARETAPWLDFWRDNYAFVASRVAAGLRRIFESSTSPANRIPLPAFMHLCEEASLSLTGPGLVALSTLAFQEVKAAFRAMLSKHATDSEYQLTHEDCHLIRNHFEYPKFDEYTYPSADLQLGAKSSEAIALGEYRWILAELHPPVAMLHHGGFWCCPDKELLSKALAQTTGDKPNFHFGFFAADFTAHTTVHLFDALPELSNFVAPQRGNPSWRTIRPADAEVYIDADTGDVCLRKIDDKKYLGSFARNWVIPLGFHPFYFSGGDHTPRLRCGEVIVQRRGWIVRAGELGSADFSGISRNLVLAVERIRAEKGWPRHIYIRPTEQVLRRSGAEGRDKDTKPIYIDLESYLFLEIFHRWLTKAGELEVTEMLPTPEELLWQEADGRHTFELRTLILPDA